jgi:uncharacterized membrane-anchored protein
MKKQLAILLGALVVAQFAVLASMIHGKERILREGEAFRFKTQPIDPADPFRGRYVRLGFEADYIPLAKGASTDLEYREPIYATITNDEEGFAHFAGWSRERPATGAFLKTRYLGEHSEWDQAATNITRTGLSIALPFDRYYMDEAKAPRAEQAVRDATRSTNCWATVRILSGKAVVEDVFAQGQSLRMLTSRK